MIGKLDRRITFIQPVTTTGTSNEDKITAWEEIDSIPTVWASLSQSRGTVGVDQDRIIYAQTSTFIIRYRTDLNIRMRVVDEDSRCYAVLSIAEVNDNRKRYLNITTNLIDNVYFT
jgi:SPP1 family predicted phage head-tail adaptor